jgi:transposase
MEKSPQATSHSFTPTDRCRLVRALQHTSDVRTYRRLQAVLLVAQGWSVPQAAHTTATRRWAVYSWVRRYRQDHQPDTLLDAPRSGRPRVASRITDARIKQQFRRDPFRLGYNTTAWTVPVLAQHLSQTYHCPISARTLRRRMRRLGLRWKRPRYVYATKDPHRTQKKGQLFAA